MRQILEILHAVALLCALAVAHFRAKYILLFLSFVLLMIPIIRLHPNENIYFNVLIHLLPQESKTKLYDWGITYGNIYKQGVEWLNQNAPENANLAHLAGPDYAISPLRLRSDISLSPYHFSGFDQRGEYIMTLANPLDPPVFAKRYLDRNLVPVHTIDVRGEPLLYIYKNDPQYAKQDTKSREVIVVAKAIRGEERDYWQIDLEKEYQVTGILVRNPKKDCSANIDSGELIFFLPQDQSETKINPADAFVINEKKITQEGIFYVFPAEAAKTILIFPRSDASCFSGGILTRLYVYSGN